MSHSIIAQLVKKDFLILRKTILMFSLVSLASIGVLSLLFGHIPMWAFLNISFLLLLAPAVTCGIVLLMRTNVFEKEKNTQIFIMSLPVTVKEFTLAKLLINIPVFSAFWCVVSGIAFYFAFWLGIFPKGTLPFLTMVFLGVFVAYICILSASLIFQSLSKTLLSIMTFELGTVAYLWIVVFLDPVQKYIYAVEMVWNSTVITIVFTQITVAIFMILMTLYIQNKKRDFM